MVYLAPRNFLTCLFIITDIRPGCQYLFMLFRRKIWLSICFARHSAPWQNILLQTFVVWIIMILKDSFSVAFGTYRDRPTIGGAHEGRKADTYRNPHSHNRSRRSFFRTVFHQHTDRIFQPGIISAIINCRKKAVVGIGISGHQNTKHTGK